MSTEALIEKVAEDSDLDEDDIKEKVEEKMEEFEGLVSEEGAVHLVAKEHGIDLSEERSKNLEIKNIVPEMRKVQITGKILNISDRNTFEREDGEGKVQNLVLGDSSSTIRVTLWDEQTEIAENVEEGDVIEISGAYSVEDNRGKAELRLGDNAQVKMSEKEFDDVELQTATEVPVSEISGENNTFTIKGMVMKVYTSNPFFRVDPDSGDTVKEDSDGNYVTDDGTEVEEPEGRLAISAVIDDGSSSIRTVFFGQQARKLLDVDEDTEKDMDLQTVEDAAKKTEGLEAKVEGRTRYNDYFGRIELLANNIEALDAEKELEMLLEILEA